MKSYPVETKIDGTKILVKAFLWGPGGGWENWLHFDTGSDVIAIPKEVLKKIGARKIKTVKVQGVTGGTSGELYSANIDCGGIRLEGIEIYSSDIEFLIGMNFVMRGRIGFFFNGQQLIWITQ